MLPGNSILPFLVPLAMGLFGLFAIILGIETFASGQIEMLNRLYSRREYFTAHLLAQAYAILQQRAEAIPDKESRISFLNMPHNRRVLDA